MPDKLGPTTVSGPRRQQLASTALLVENLPADAGDEGLIPGSGRSPVGDNGNPLQYSCLENPIDRGPQCRPPGLLLEQVARFFLCLLTQPYLNAGKPAFPLFPSSGFVHF